jgi:carbonic anhydrase/acetyltransferase-like protein (isoleucine patch superfamily)
MFGKSPAVAPTAFVAQNASLIGDVSVGKSSSVWFGAVLRGDLKGVRVGDNSNIQDNAVVCNAHNSPAVDIGNNVTVGEWRRG